MCDSDSQKRRYRREIVFVLFKHLYMTDRVGIGGNQIFAKSNGIVSSRGASSPHYKFGRSSAAKNQQTCWNLEGEERSYITTLNVR